MLEPGSVSISAPYFISGRSGVLTGLASPNAVARLMHFGMLDPRTPGAIVPTPIQISQIRLRYAPATVATNTGVVLELLKGTVAAPGAQHTTGGTLHLPQRRKTTGYPAIGATETSLYVSTTGAITGGDVFTPLEAAAPIDVVSSPAGTAEAECGNSIWLPSDLCPLQLEAGEALELRVAAFSATGILLVAFDFLR
jgi:hypothetical protein